MTAQLIRALAPPLLLAALGLPAPASAAEIRVLASPGIREVFLELAPQFEAASGHRVVATWAGTPDVVKRVGAGEPFDLVIAGSGALDELTRAGRFAPGARTDLARSGVGVAVRAGAPKPDISSGAAVKKALLAASSIGYSSGPSGVYMASLFQRMGLAEELKPKLKQAPPGASVGQMVARGEVELGFHQISELLPVTGITLVGPLPPDIQEITVFSAGVPIGAGQAEAARALVRHLTAPAAVPVIKRKGMEPA